MNFARHDAASLMANPTGSKRGPGGRRLCKWCGTEVEGRRTHWCSDACVTEYLIRTSSTHARRAVRKRDHGICSICCLDTVKLRKDMGRGTLAMQRARMVLFGLKPGSHIRTLWEMDHIRPVSEGGGSCGLENLRTLCLWCHWGETRKLRKRLAKPKYPKYTLFNRPSPNK